jgi:hypothetical protein
MKVLVTSTSMNLFTNFVHQPRTEVIDTVTNRLFQDCDTVDEVIAQYEHFWNIPMAREVVRVFEAVKVSDDYLVPETTTNVNNLKKVN